MLPERVNMLQMFKNKQLILYDFHKITATDQIRKTCDKPSHIQNRGEIIQQNLTTVNFVTLTSFKTKIQIGIVGTEDS